MSYINPPSELVNDDMFLTGIAVPEFGSGVLWEGINASLFPSKSGLAGTSTSPEDVRRAFNGRRDGEVATDASNCMVRSDSDITRNVLNSSGLGGLPNCIPVLGAISLDRQGSQLESSMLPILYMYDIQYLEHTLY